MELIEKIDIGKTYSSFKRRNGKIKGTKIFQTYKKTKTY